MRTFRVAVSPQRLASGGFHVALGAAGRTA